jgi:hypothetical protein
MNLNALHRRLLQDVLEIGNAFPFVITGGYAVQAHGLVDRLSRDGRGWQVRVIGVDPISARFMVTDPGTSEDCEVDILKEGFNRPPESTPWGPVLALDDVIGTKVRALADRGYPRDLVDIHAAARIRSQNELESLGRKCAWDEFSLEGLADRLSSVQWRADEEFSAYGLSGDEIAHLRRWAQAWSDDINRRLYAENFDYEEGEDG